MGNEAKLKRTLIS